MNNLNPAQVAQMAQLAQLLQMTGGAPPPNAVNPLFLANLRANAMQEAAAATQQRQSAAGFFSRGNVAGMGFLRQPPPSFRQPPPLMTMNANYPANQLSNQININPNNDNSRFPNQQLRYLGPMQMQQTIPTSQFSQAQRIAQTQSIATSQSFERDIYDRDAYGDVSSAVSHDRRRDDDEAPRSAIETPRSAIEAPRSAIEAPRSAIETPRSAIEAPRSTIEADAPASSQTQSDMILDDGTSANGLHLNSGGSGGGAFGSDSAADRRSQDRSSDSLESRPTSFGFGRKTPLNLPKQDVTTRIECALEVVPAVVIGVECIRECEHEDGPLGYECDCCSETCLTKEDVVPHVLSTHHRRYYLQTRHADFVQRMQSRDRANGEAFDVDRVAELFQEQFGSGKITRIPKKPLPTSAEEEPPRRPGAAVGSLDGGVGGEETSQSMAQQQQPQQQRGASSQRDAYDGSERNAYDQAAEEEEIDRRDEDMRQPPHRDASFPSSGNEPRERASTDVGRRSYETDPRQVALCKDVLELVKLEEIEVRKLRAVEREIQDARSRPFNQASYERLKELAQSSMGKLQKIDKGKKMLQTQNSERLMSVVKELIDALNDIDREREYKRGMGAWTQALDDAALAKEIDIKRKLEEIEANKIKFDAVLEGRAPPESLLPPLEVRESVPLREAGMPTPRRPPSANDARVSKDKGVESSDRTSRSYENRSPVPPQADSYHQSNNDQSAQPNSHHQSGKFPNDLFKGSSQSENYQQLQTSWHDDYQQSSRRNYHQSGQPDNHDQSSRYDNYRQSGQPGNFQQSGQPDNYQQSGQPDNNPNFSRHDNYRQSSQPDNYQQLDQYDISRSSQSGSYQRSSPAEKNCISNDHQLKTSSAPSFPASSQFGSNATSRSHGEGSRQIPTSNVKSGFGAGVSSANSAANEAQFRRPTNVTSVSGNTISNVKQYSATSSNSSYQRPSASVTSVSSFHDGRGIINQRNTVNNAPGNPVVARHSATNVTPIGGQTSTMPPTNTHAGPEKSASYVRRETEYETMLKQIEAMVPPNIAEGTQPISVNPIPTPTPPENLTRSSGGSGGQPAVNRPVVAGSSCAIAYGITHDPKPSDSDVLIIKESAGKESDRPTSRSRDTRDSRSERRSRSRSRSRSRRSSRDDRSYGSKSRSPRSGSRRSRRSPSPDTRWGRPGASSTSSQRRSISPGIRKWGASSKTPVVRGSGRESIDRSSARQSSDKSPSPDTKRWGPRDADAAGSSSKEPETTITSRLQDISEDPPIGVRLDDLSREPLPDSSRKLPSKWGPSAADKKWGKPGVVTLTAPKSPSPDTKWGKPGAGDTARRPETVSGGARATSIELAHSWARQFELQHQQNHAQDNDNKDDEDEDGPSILPTFASRAASARSMPPKRPPTAPAVAQQSLKMKAMTGLTGKMGGRTLKTGMVPKARTPKKADSGTDYSDPMSAYMKEVRKFSATNCEKLGNVNRVRSMR